MKALAYYPALPCTIELVRAENATWFARMVELPGCMSAGDSAEDTVGRYQPAPLRVTGVEGHVFHDPGAAEYEVTKPASTPQGNA